MFPRHNTSKMPDMLVRLKRGKTTFEVMVEEGKVTQYRDGTIKNISEVVTADVVWVNAHKGKRASSEQLTKSFQTDNVQDIIKQILEKGESQEGAGERKQKLDDARGEVIAYIVKHYIDPGTNLPLPVTRVENALQQVKARIDPETPAARQVAALVPKLLPVLAMKKGGASIYGVVTVRSKLAGATGAAIRKHGAVERENFGGGYCKFEIEVDVQSQALMLTEISRATKGEYEWELASQEAGGTPGAGASSSAGPAKKGNKGKKGKKKN